MAKVLMWAGCSLILFLVFLRVTAPAKTEGRVPSHDLSISQATPHVEKKTSMAVEKKEETMATMNTEAAPASLPKESAAPVFDLKVFGIDEILSMPFTEQKRFLAKNQLKNPENFERFRNLSQLTAIDRFLKGRFQGRLEGAHGPEDQLILDIDGAIEENHFQGELAVEILDKNQEPVSRSHIRGPLEDHIRVVDDGERNSLLIQPTGSDYLRLYQVFIGADNRQKLAGNYYGRDKDGRLVALGSFVLKRL